MKAFILSAGMGQRLKPLTNKVPKVMLPVGGKPVLEHLILLGKSFGIKDFIINLFWLPEQIVKYFGDGKHLGVNIIYSYEEELLGTAGALKKMEDDLKETFLVLYGDVLMNVNLLNIIKYHKAKRGIGTLVLHDSSHPEDSDLFEINKRGRIINYWLKSGTEKTESILSNAGLLILEPKIFSYISTKNKVSNLENDIFPILIKEKMKLFGYKTNEYLKDIGTLKRYNEVVTSLSL